MFMKKTKKRLTELEQASARQNSDIHNLKEQVHLAKVASITAPLSETLVIHAHERLLSSVQSQIKSRGLALIESFKNSYGSQVEVWGKYNSSPSVKAKAKKKPKKVSRGR